MSAVEITSLSSKGQVVIPNSIRLDLGISLGSKLAVISDGENILLRPIEAPKIETFEKLIATSRKYAKQVGMKKTDIAKAINHTKQDSSRVSDVGKFFGTIKLAADPMRLQRKMRNEW